MFKVDRLNGQNYADNIIDPLLANNEQSGWSVTTGTGSVAMNPNFVFQGKKSLKIQNNTPTADILVSNSIQESVIPVDGEYGLSFYLLKDQAAQGLSGEVVIYQNASPFNTQTFELNENFDGDDLDKVWVRFDSDVSFEFDKGDVITITIQLDGIPGTVLVNTSLYVDGLMLYAKHRLNAMPPEYTLPIGSNLKYNVLNISDNFSASANDVILMDATLDAFSVFLPKASTSLNRPITVKKLDNVNDVTIDADGAETIDGSGTLILDTQWQSATLISNGSNWYKI